MKTLGSFVSETFEKSASMKPLTCAVLVLAITAFAVVTAGCATSAQPQHMASAKEPIAAAAMTNDSQFVARLIAGSPWQGTWQSATQAFSLFGKLELIFRMEDGKLKAAEQNVTGCPGTCKEGEFQILELSDSHIKMLTPNEGTIVYKLDNGKLVGEGTSSRGARLSSTATPSTK